MNYKTLKEFTDQYKAQIIAVSKTKPIEDIQRLYDQGQRDFGENKVQEILLKQPQLPADIRWHMIGHLQSNKVKKLLPVVHLIQSVDSEKLLRAIDQAADMRGTLTPILLQVHIAQEESKFGLDPEEAIGLVKKIAAGEFGHIYLKGLMGMSTFTNDQKLVQNEFKALHELYQRSQMILPHLDTLSMGMSGDFKIALAEGSTMIRVGSLLFGERNYN